jgi:CHAT domain-containing protein
MAALLRGLCLILMLWMTGSRPSTVIPPRSPDSSLWWGQESLDINQKALRYRNAGDLRAAEGLYRQGYQKALQLDDKLAAVRYLMSAGGCQLLAFHYRDALADFLQARELAAAIRDHADLGAIAVNLSSVYLQVWDFDAAMGAAEDGLAETRAQRQSYFEPYLLLELGRLHATLGDGRAETFFMDGIEAARAEGDIALEAQGWDLLGDERLVQQHAVVAEQAFNQAFRLRRLNDSTDLGLSFGRLGAVKLAEGNLDAASRFTDLAIAAIRRGAPAWPEYILLHQRGRIRLALHQADAALADFSTALDASARWRLEVPPARSSLTGTNVALEQEIFHSFIELAAAHALQTGNAVWAEKAFQAVEINRAASLRESIGLAQVWRDKLPPEYWEILGQLGAEQARRIQDARPNARADRLLLRLTEMEAQAGLGLRAKKDENFRSRSSLIHFQEGLRESELFLSFSLGKKESYLWAVSRNSLRLYRLAPEQDIARAVQAFREALPAGGPEAIRRGQHLYQELFGELQTQEISKTAWLLSLEGVLFEVPFAALVTEQRNENTVYLVERHSLQTVPGALLLGVSADPGGQGGSYRGELLGVGDPVYNTADSRWRGPVPDSDSGGQLDRLIGSGEEIEASARTWRGGSGTATILTGAEARRERFLNLLGHQPAVIHLATHVLIPGASRELGFVAFSLNPASSGPPRPEYLSTSEIARLSVPGALVVMTGCATGTGDVRAGAGLLGLTHAWLMAGAGAVVSTDWPVEDASGEIFSRFYLHLRNSPAAEALRRSQMEFAHSGTWRAAPVYWASYQLTGGSRQ